MLICSGQSDKKAEVVVVSKHITDGESFQKQMRTDSIVVPLLSGEKFHVSSQALCIGSWEWQEVLNKRKSKASELSTENYMGIYNVTSRLAKASSEPNFGQIADDDAEEARIRLRRMLPSGEKLKRAVASPISEIRRRLKTIRNAVSGIEAELLLSLVLFQTWSHQQHIGRVIFMS